MTSRLPNYLKTFRKRSGLSQEEMAYLLGTKSKAQICRYERFGNQAPLDVAFACAVLFGIPLKELFAGTLEEVERRLRRRAKLLARKIGDAKPDRQVARKRQTLEAISSSPASEPNKPL